MKQGNLIFIRKISNQFPKGKIEVLESDKDFRLLQIRKKELSMLGFYGKSKGRFKIVESDYNIFKYADGKVLKNI